MTQQIHFFNPGPLRTADIKTEMSRALKYFKIGDPTRNYIGSCFLMISKIVRDYYHNVCYNAEFRIMSQEDNFMTVKILYTVGGGRRIKKEIWELSREGSIRRDGWRRFGKFMNKFGPIFSMFASGVASIGLGLTGN